MSFKTYDVDGYDTPLRLSDAHAKAIGAKVHVDTDDAEADDAGDPPRPTPRARKPKSE